MKYIWLCLLLCMVSSQALACDICGCSVNGTYMGILPQFRKNFIGIRYQFRQFETEHPKLFENEISTFSKEDYHTQEIWGRFVPVKRLHVFAFVPYAVLSKTENGKKEQTNGFGDASFLLNYIVSATEDSSDALWQHSWQIGGGIKLPTGESRKESPNTKTINPNMQLGTGAFDILFNTNYTLRRAKAGLTAEASYRYNTVNNFDYRFGDRINAGMKLFYWHNMKGISLLPQAGLQYEYAAQDYLYHSKNIYQDYTGGNILHATVGLESYFSHFSLALNMQQPVYQNLAENYITSGARFTAQFLYLIK